ncbi:membrane protein [Synechococcus sp. 60AY4M2]|nr:membrane protein [Synechococcus sp. 60AY4M2]PIL00464.1 membrane protein [Synechococcus sp. 65AY640]
MISVCELEAPMAQSGLFPQPIWQRLLMIAPFFLWGSAMVAMRDALSETTPLFMAILRLLPAGILVLAFRLWQGRASAASQPWHPQGLRGWLWVLAFALVDGTCFQGFLAQGLRETGAGLGSVLIDSQPLAVALMATWFYRERMGSLGWLSLGLGVLGISLIGLGGEGSLQVGAGVVWMLLASLSMAIGTVMMPKVAEVADPVLATGWHMVLGSLPLILLSALTESEQWQHLSGAHWLGLLYASVMGSAVAYALFFYFASQENLTEFSSLTFLTPIFALLFGSTFLGETLTPVQWVGVGITLVCVYVINHRQEWQERLRLAWPGILSELGLEFSTVEIRDGRPD